MSPFVLETEKISSARVAGRVVRGALIGILLVPALCGLVAFVGGVSPFAYQGF